MSRKEVKTPKGKGDKKSKFLSPKSEWGGQSLASYSKKEGKNRRTKKRKERVYGKPDKKIVARGDKRARHAKGRKTGVQSRGREVRRTIINCSFNLVKE